MNVRTIGCLELNSIAWGLHVADEMAKAAQVDLSGSVRPVRVGIWSS